MASPFFQARSNSDGSSALNQVPAIGSISAEVDRLQHGLHPLVALERIGRDLMRQAPRIDRAEVGDHHDRELRCRHTQELGAEARPQAAMACRFQPTQLAHADAAAIAVVVAAGQRFGGHELGRGGDRLAEDRRIEVPRPDQQVLDRRGQPAFAALRIGVRGAAEAWVSSPR